MILKILTFATIAASLYFLLMTIYKGRQLAAQSGTNALSDHQGEIVGFICTVAVTVGLILLQIYINPEPREGSFLFTVHRVAVGAGVVLFLAIVLRFTGARKPSAHRPLVYIFTALYLVIIATGLPLLVELPTPS